MGSIGARKRRAAAWCPMGCRCITGRVGRLAACSCWRTSTAPCSASRTFAASTAKIARAQFTRRARVCAGRECWPCAAGHSMGWRWGTPSGTAAPLASTSPPQHATSAGRRYLRPQHGAARHSPSLSKSSVRSTKTTAPRGSQRPHAGHASLMRRMGWERAHHSASLRTAARAAGLAMNLRQGVAVQAKRALVFLW